MTHSAVESARLLVIVSGDFGELGAALFWLSGLKTTVPPLVLLPVVLADAVPEDGARHHRIYRSAADIDAALAAFKPDTVLLASGYLLGVNSGLSLLAVLRLVGRLRRDGVILLTSDPFLGLQPWPAWPATSLRRLPSKGTALATHVYLLWLACRVWPLRRALRQAWHVYPAPTDRLPWLGGARQRAYCSSPAPALPATGPSAAPPAGAGADANADTRPVWLFVLARVDLALLSRRADGGDLDSLLKRLSEVDAMGRRAVLIAPPSLVVRVQAHFGADSPVLALSTLSHTAYLDWLQRAELAFFWNLLSFSLMHRVLAGRPVVFFDPGHFTHLFPAVADAGQSLFYDGWQAPLRRLDQPFDLDAMLAAAGPVARQFQVIARGLRRSPSPADLLAEIHAERRAQAGGSADQPSRPRVSR